MQGATARTLFQLHFSYDFYAFEKLYKKWISPFPKSNQLSSFMAATDMQFSETSTKFPIKTFTIN